MSIGCKKDACKPACDPCSKQPEIKYCGRPVDCLDVKRGDPLDQVIKKIGDKLCRVSNYVKDMTHIDIIPATEELCPYGGYTFNTINTITGEIVDSETICDEQIMSVYVDGDYISNPVNLNFESGNDIDITGNYDPLTDVTTIIIDSAREDIEQITWQDGMGLIASEAVVPNQLYFITDRGWYLEGLTPTSFNIDGHMYVSVAKEEYYTPLGLNKGVWTPYTSTPYSIGDIVVYGGKVWSNVSGGNGSILTLHTLNSTWELQTDPIYYSDVLLKIHVNYEQDWVFRNEDKRGNIIHIPYNIYGLITDHRNVWADWNRPVFSANDIMVCLNNASNKQPTIITRNHGKFSITFNRSSRIEFNSVKGEIMGNDVANISFNTVYSIKYNIGIAYMFNIEGGVPKTGTIFNNNIDYFQNNIINASVYENNVETFNRNRVFGDVMRNTITSVTDNEILGIMRDNSEIDPIVFELNRICDEFSDNTFSYNISNNNFKGEVKNNVELNIANSNLVGITNNGNIIIYHLTVAGTINGNNTTTIKWSNSKGNIENNSNVSIDGSTFNDASDNKDVQLLNSTIGQNFSNNITGYFTSNIIIFSISGNVNIKHCESNRSLSIINNSNITALNYNSVVGGIEDNAGLDEIKHNNNNGVIRHNTVNSGVTGAIIERNSNNGSIFYNTITANSVAINYNNNNGDIGIDLTPTNRGTSITGVINNL